VRVELAHHVADDTGALHVAAVRPVAGVEHGVQDLAVDRLEAVAHVGQRPTDDDAHRVVEVRALHLDLDTDGLDAAAGAVVDAAGRSGHAGRAGGLAGAGADRAAHRIRLSIFRARRVIGQRVIGCGHRDSLRDRSVPGRDSERMRSLRARKLTPRSLDVQETHILRVALDE
jgi:hypothetical protein